MSHTQFTYATIELGKVDRHKLKSYVHYFGQYLDVESPIFEDQEFGDKVVNEAKDICKWLKEPSNWPEGSKDNESLHDDAATLFYFFSNIQIKGAERKAIEHLNLKKEDLSEEDILRIIEMNGRLGEDEDNLNMIDRLSKISPEKAAERGYYLHRAKEEYSTGNFALALENVDKQLVLSPEDESAEQFKFALSMWVDIWGYIPQYVKFKGKDNSIPTPIPAD